MTTVRIYQPCQSAMQSGKGKTNLWVMEFENDDPLMPDPLMGWVSSIDTKEELHLPFPTLEKAIQYAKSKGFEYQIYNSAQNETIPKSYGTNFTCKRMRGL